MRRLSSERLCLLTCVSIVFTFFVQGCGSVAQPTIVPTARPTNPPPTVTLEPTPVPPTEVPTEVPTELPAAAEATAEMVLVAADPTAQALQAREAAHQSLPVGLESGREVYEFRCAPCHGVNGAGVIGPSFRDRPLLTSDFVLNRVRSGPENMSAFTVEELPDAQVVAIFDYLQNEIVGLDMPEYTEEQVQEGRALYREYCRECHGAFGQGLDNLGPAINLWPPLSISRIVDGGLLPLPNMPRLTVTPDELRLIAAFLYDLALS